MKKQLLAASLVAVVSSIGCRVGAQEASSCSSRVTRSNAVPCVLAASLAVKAEGQELEAAEARSKAVSHLLPSNPVLRLGASSRSAAGVAGVYNWDAALSQEFEIAGQRGIRREAAQAEVDAQAKRVLIARRDVAAAAWIAYFNALTAHEEQRLAGRLTTATQMVSVVAHARAEKGLIAPVDADVADAITLRVLQAKLESDRRVATADAHLLSLLGLDPTRGTLAVAGELVPIAGVEAAAASLIPRAPTERLEVLALDAERKAFELRADAYRRTRIPNPTVSVYAQNDGFNEHVLGVAIAFPVPLPGNVGRTYAGEIAEAEALARRVETDRERVGREIRLEILVAAQAYASRAKEVEAFTPERVTRAEETLRSLGEEVEAGHLGVRDAVVAQQAMIELLQANVASRRAWCVASVDLARAAGLSLEGGMH